jgi:hypothetical protein
VTRDQITHRFGLTIVAPATSWFIWFIAFWV